MQAWIFESQEGCSNPYVAGLMHPANLYMVLLVHQCYVLLAMACECRSIPDAVLTCAKEFRRIVCVFEDDHCIGPSCSDLWYKAGR